ncbi:Aste57867_47 [Aphanomyces stellatus]|uniref:Aste57867_47 protein n=1 Tax=Aphanomyces stellatus TaxID=120398 RepID=A0A485K6J4_9STRA|nr:hypothetical protein As57867_000047 [Aphanomyces stellatus]VFT77273.1 Aste57867_47 [Aphanomyces stellatus]
MPTIQSDNSGLAETAQHTELPPPPLSPSRLLLEFSQTMDLAYICNAEQQQAAAAAAAAAAHANNGAIDSLRLPHPISTPPPSSSSSGGAPIGTTCFFNDCHKEVQPGSWKCVFHRNRARCLVTDCQNQVYARNLCVRHGGKKQCQHDGCTGNARLGNFCSKHGTGSIKKKCTEEGCTKMAHARHKCVRHGGGRKCKMDGCQTHARNGGYCCRHNRQLATKQDKSSSSTASSPTAAPPSDSASPYMRSPHAGAATSFLKEEVVVGSTNGLEILNLTIERYKVGQVEASPKQYSDTRENVYA